jgi:hypothetical protein
VVLQDYHKSVPVHYFQLFNSTFSESTSLCLFEFTFRNPNLTEDDYSIRQNQTTPQLSNISQLFRTRHQNILIMLASEFFNERVCLRAQGKLPPGDPIVYDARDTPQNRARFKAFNEYVLNYGQNLEGDFAESRRAELPDEEDGGDYAASKPSNQSTRIKSHVSKGCKYGSTKRRLFTNNTRGGKSIGDVSTGRVDSSEYCTSQTVAAVGQDEEDSDTIVVDCGEGMEEQLSARKRNNMRQPTARQIHQQLNKTIPRKNSQNSEVTAKIG